MDPIAHTFTGAALATAGLRRVTPLATAALLIGANVPDVDVFAGYAGEFTARAVRRGWTHGVLALAVWPFVVTGLLLGWARLRRASHPQPARLLAVAALAVLTHPTLDWLNNYGLRWLMPFDGRWFYGDALFIVDPWIWLLLGGVVCLRYSRRRLAIAGWIAFGLASSALVLTTPIPTVARALWCLGVLGVIAARLGGFGTGPGEPRLDRAARTVLLVAAAYMAFSTLANVPARALIEAQVARLGLAPLQDIMVAPIPADPFGGYVVLAAADHYRIADWHWLKQPRFVARDDIIPMRLGDPAVVAAAATPAARNFLVWSRYPYAEIEPAAAGHTVRFSDARYIDQGGLLGPVVELDRDLRPIGPGGSP